MPAGSANPRGSPAPRAAIVLALCAIPWIGACSASGTGLPNQVSSTQTDSVIGGVYAGRRGIVVDTRELFRKGYRPTSVSVAFPDHSRLDAEIAVDPTTNLAFFVVENDSLTDAERQAFIRGTVRSSIVVYGDDAVPASATLAPSLFAAGANSVELARSSAPRTVDASNTPVRIDNAALAERLAPLALSPSTPYLIVADGRDAVVTRTASNCSNCFRNEVWPYYEGSILTDTIQGAPRRRQDFYFVAVANQPDTYRILTLSDPARGTYLRVTGTVGNEVVQADSVPGEFVMVQEPGSRVRIKDRATGLFLLTPSASSQRWSLGAQGTRLRLLAPHVELTIENLGTSFNQPIIPPARIAFAIQSTIRNCSPATVQDVVGRTETRSITRSFATTESFQVVSESARSHSIAASGNVQVKYEPGEDTGGVDVEVNHAWGKTWASSYGTSVMRDTTRTSQSDTTTTVEITRARGITVPPFSAVRVSDLVRTNERPLIVPWTQTLRIRGKDQQGRDPLSGPELVSLLRFNLVGAVPVRVEGTFVDVTLRGSTTADNFYKTETNATELPNACN